MVRVQAFAGTDDTGETIDVSSAATALGLGWAPFFDGVTIDAVGIEKLLGPWPA